MMIISYTGIKREMLFLLNRDGAQSIEQMHQAIMGSKARDVRMINLIRDLKDEGLIIQEGHMLCITAAGRAA